MSKQGRRAHVKRAKLGRVVWRFGFLKGSSAGFVSTYWPEMLRAGRRKDRKLVRRVRKLINRAHAIRGGYKS